MPPPIGTQKSRNAPSAPTGQPCGRGALGSSSARQNSSDIQQTLCGAVPTGATSRAAGKAPAARPWINPRGSNSSTCWNVGRFVVGKRFGQQSRHEARRRRRLPPQARVRLTLLRGERVGGRVDRLPQRVARTRASEPTPQYERLKRTRRPDRRAACGGPCRRRTRPRGRRGCGRCPGRRCSGPNTGDITAFAIGRQTASMITGPASS